MNKTTNFVDFMNILLVKFRFDSSLSHFNYVNTMNN